MRMNWFTLIYSATYCQNTYWFIKCNFPFINPCWPHPTFLWCSTSLIKPSYYWYQASWLKLPDFSQHLFPNSGASFVTYNAWELYKNLCNAVKQQLLHQAATFKTSDAGHQVHRIYCLLIPFISSILLFFLMLILLFLIHFRSVVLRDSKRIFPQSQARYLFNFPAISTSPQFHQFSQNVSNPN